MGKVDQKRINGRFKGKRFLLIPSVSVMIVAFLSLAGYLEYRGIIWHTSIFTLPYELRGLDISHHQGEIDWAKVPSEKYRFIFMKATEGDDFVDPDFNKNWKNSRNKGFLTGAYHFFLASSSGKDQAENIIRTVPLENNALPVVIDIEIRVEHDRNLAVDQQESVRQNLQIMIDMIFFEYGKMPILYVSDVTYTAFVKGYFPGCEIWIREIIKPARLKGGRKWLFWQYCNRGHVPGIDGYVDLNVFAGNQEELIELIK